MSAGSSQPKPVAGQYYCPSCERMYPEGDACPEDGSRLVRIKAVRDPLLGRVLDNRYTIIEKLGQGGMGAVYRASQHSVDREVAVKVVNAHLVSDHDAIRRFLREAKIASKLSHPNAVAVLDFGQSDDGLFYLVMELVSGRTLDEVVEAEGTFRPERLVRIGAQVCDALEGAHALQIVHRDLKPANIMLLAHGRDLVKVLDFGLAKSVATDKAVTTMTNAGALLGTPAYMPPELALGQPCDARADLYALGCILYRLGSGQLPFTSDSPHELIAAHAHDPAPPMTGVPPALASVIDRLLQKDPALRYQSAAETREALEAALDHRLATPVPFDALRSDPYVSAPPARLASAPGSYVDDRDTVATPALSLHESSPKKRWVVPLLAAFALAGAGLGALVVTRGANEPTAAAAPVDDTPAPAVAPAPTNDEPEPTPDPTPDPTPEPTTAGAAAVATPEDSQPVDASVDDKVADKPANVAPAKPDKPSTKTTRVTKPVKPVTKPPVTKPPPSKPPPSKPPDAPAKGGGGALPF